MPGGGISSDTDFTATAHRFLAERLRTVRREPQQGFDARARPTHSRWCSTGAPRHSALERKAHAGRSARRFLVGNKRAETRPNSRLPISYLFILVSTAISTIARSIQYPGRRCPRALCRLRDASPSSRSDYRECRSCRSRVRPIVQSPCRRRR